MLKLVHGCLLIGMFILTSLPLHAQSSASSFKYQVSPYFWMPNIDGTVGALGGNARVDDSNLKFGAMGSFEGHSDRWVFLADTMYIHEESDNAIPEEEIFTTANVDSKILIVDPEFGYRLLRRDHCELSLLAGVRYWHLRNELEFAGPGIGPIGSIGLAESRNWVDPVVGVLLRRDIGSAFHVTLKGDIGGFSAAARLNWQASGSVGYRLNNRYSVILGYRVLGVDYAKDGFVFDTTMQGLVVGANIRF